MAKTMKPGSEKGRAALKLAEVKKPAQNDAGELPDSSTVLDLLKDEGSISSKLARLRGEIGALVKNAETDHNVHRGAFKMTAKLKKMDASARAEFLRHFDHYRDAAELDEQADLFDAESGEDVEGAPVN